MCRMEAAVVPGTALGTGASTSTVVVTTGTFAAAVGVTTAGGAASPCWRAVTETEAAARLFSHRDWSCSSGSGSAVCIASTMSLSDARMWFAEAPGLKGRLMIFGKILDSLKATSTGSTPSLRSRSVAPGLMTSSVVSR